MAETVTQYYIEGIKEGRKYMDNHGATDAADILANLESTIKGFASSTPVGQMLRGERDFWKNQIRRIRN